MSFNTVILVGNLGRDPELRYTTQGTAVCQFSMATNDRVKKGGEWEKHTTWFRVTVFGRQAEACQEFLTKGRECYVQGRMRVEEWQDKDGGKRWTAEVTADKVQFLGSRQDGEGRGGSERRERSDHDQRRKETDQDYDQRNEVEDSPRKNEPITDEDIPF